MEKQSKVIFLDIDGPMIPVRAQLIQQSAGAARTFDPVAVSLLLDIISKSGAKLVISSTIGVHGYEHCCDMLDRNGISPSNLHQDWITPRKMSSYRIHEIVWWLDKHPEITHYVAIDDEQLDIDWVKFAVQCDAYEGFSFRNYLECAVMLDAVDVEQQAEHRRLIGYLKRREVWRTTRDDRERQRLYSISDELFPLKDQND